MIIKKIMKANIVRHERYEERIKESNIKKMRLSFKEQDQMQIEKQKGGKLTLQILPPKFTLRDRQTQTLQPVICSYAAFVVVLDLMFWTFVDSSI